MNHPDSVNRRVLIVDDNAAIHQDFAKVLGSGAPSSGLDDMEASLFGSAPDPRADPGFELDFADQGHIALARVKAALAEGRPYSVAFVDIRMPPGWDGVETAAQLWAVDPRLQIVICSAYSDYSWEQMRERLGPRQQMLILKKPFDAIEVLQLAHALTEKWQLLLASKRNMEELEAAVASRTRSLEQTHQKLQDAEARLSHSLRLAALGRVAGGIAHEINNPLSFIVSNLRFIDRVIHELETPVSGSADLEQATVEALNGAERIRRIVRDVKIFSQADAAPIADVSLDRIVERAVEMARSELDARGTLTIDVPGGCFLRASEEGMVQVLHNLLVNAAHALSPSRKNENRVVLRAKRSGARVLIEVRDNGNGIPPENLARVFEPFFTTKDIGSGTGLGLCICHGIVRKLNGDISATSAPGQETCFTIDIPAAESVQPALASAPLPGAREART